MLTDEAKDTAAPQLDINDYETALHLESERNKFARLRDRASAEANTTERSLSGQLILLTTVLITVNLIALGNEGLLTALTDFQKSLIITAFIFEAIATFAGIIHYFKMENSYNQWADAYQRVVQIFDGRDFDSESDLAHQVEAAQESVPIRRIRRSLHAQVASIGISFAVYLILLISVFFRWF